MSLFSRICGSLKVSSYAFFFHSRLGKVHLHLNRQLMAPDKDTIKPTVPLKLLLDETKTRVLAAEATSDFVDVLLSFLALPLGTIIRVTNNSSGTIGCMNNLYQSIQQLDTGIFSTEASKSILLNPINPHSAIFRDLKLNIDDSRNGKFYSCPNCKRWSYYPYVRCCKGVTSVEGIWEDEGTYVVSDMIFVITDDLQVLPGLPSSLVQVLQESNVDQIMERTVDVGLEEVSKLLKRSLISKSPLTDVFVRRRDVFNNASAYKPSNLNIEDKLSANSLSIKLMFSKTEKRILAVEAKESFVDFLFSFCTIPLGALIKLLGGDSGLGCIDILYKTVKSIDPKFLYLENEDITDLGIFERYKCKARLLQIRSIECPDDLLDPRNPKPSTECFGNFLKESQLFVVSDNLIVTPSSSTSCISFLRELNVHVDDIEVRETTIGQREALALLKASLTSSSALSNGLKSLLDN